MRLHTWVLAAAIGLAPAVAAAQGATGGGGTTGTSGQTGTTGTGGQTGTSGTSGTSGTTSGTGQSGSMSTMGNGTSHWIASGFVGSDFGSQANGSSMDVGGSVGYLWNNWVGGEFLAGFSPDFQLQASAPNAFLLNGNNPAVNTYMINAIGAVPLGPDANWQPFISGGFGAIQLRSGLNNITTSIGTGGTTTVSNFDPNESRAAGNIGFGVMGFAGNWGVRGDVRYFRAFTQDTSSSTTGSNGNLNLGILPGLDFWRANIGVAVRW